MVTYKGRLRPLGRDNSIEVCDTDRTAVSSSGQAKNPTVGNTSAASGASSPDQAPDGTEDVNDAAGPSIQWTDDQRTIIEAPLDARLLVEAGPGTGKTAVACARVARLLDTGVVSSSIWLFSFTRTAVQEIRDRIRLLAQQQSEAAGVRITTIDSHAWQVHL
jgi:Rad3-related DNA helicase